MSTESNQQNLIAAVSYLGVFITGIAILIIEKSNSYIRFHAMQSTVFSVAVFLLNVIMGFLPFYNWIFQQIAMMISAIVWIVLLWKAFNGEEYELPYIGKFAREQLNKI